MLIVAHRGNIEGPGTCEHNLPKIMAAIEQGFYVELDLWYLNNQYYLGHDSPEIAVNLSDLDCPQVIFHLKNLFVPSFRYADAFAIHQDNFVFTLKGRLWCNYGVGYTANSIVCAPELVAHKEPLESFLLRHVGVLGICTDFAQQARELLESAGMDSRRAKT